MNRVRAVLSFAGRHWYATAWVVLLVYFAAIYWFGQPLPAIIVVPGSIALLAALYGPIFFRSWWATPQLVREPSAIERGIESFFGAVGGGLAAIFVAALSLAGLVFFIWLVKRIWEVVEVPA